MNVMARYMKNNRGQALVEFALALPLFLLLVAGMIDFGIILNQYMVVNEAAREGAREAALTNDNNAAVSVAKAAASTIDKGQLTVTVTPQTRKRGDSVTVTVSNKVKIVTPLISTFFPSSYQVTGSAVMRVE